MTEPRRWVLVSHFHWDREWYRSFEQYRARLIDAVDRVLSLLDEDPGYRFLLDGQAVLLEDYLDIRPARRAALVAGFATGRLAAGPWYVQPDSLLPSGEAHVRNLLLGRRVVEQLGPVSRVGYVPDSFGHPSQFPQLLSGFGIRSFVYWRGNGNEIDALGPVYRWVAPDGSAVTAHLLTEGYFGAACLPDDVDVAAGELAEAAERIAARHDGPVLLMNGFDHMPPDVHTGAVAAALAARAGATVRRGLLEDVVDAAIVPERSWQGELCGARLANLLPGVWSTRMPIKLLNRRCETLLEGWLEPWAALGRECGLADERPTIERAWRAVLQSQAHDSICGCSLDAVATDVIGRLTATATLASETTSRVLEHLAGLGTERRVPWTVEQDVAVFNPSAHERTDVVRMPFDPYPALRLPFGRPEFPPLALSAMESPGFLIDGLPARVIPTDDPARARWLPGQRPFDLEFVAPAVPPFGQRRMTVRPSAPIPDVVDAGRQITAREAAATVEDDGTLCVRLGNTEFPGLLALEDQGDRGDSYDFDAVEADPGAGLEQVTWRRRRHPSGIERLEIVRRLRVPAALTDHRTRRAREMVGLTVRCEVRVAPGVPRVDLTVEVENTALDHRLRLLFPTRQPTRTFAAATMFDVAQRSVGPMDAAGWVHEAPRTFVHQGWVHAGGLTVVAPGLPEAEVTPAGTIAVTLVRAIGWLARYDLRSRPVPAGPPMEIAGAQVPGRLRVRLALLPGIDPVAARDAELGLRGVIAGPAPRLASGHALLILTPSDLVLSAVKPAERGGGIVVRVLNPGDEPRTAELRLGFPVASVRAVRLDEEPCNPEITIADGAVRFVVPSRAVCSVCLEPPR